VERGDLRAGTGNALQLWIVKRCGWYWPVLLHSWCCCIAGRVAGRTATAPMQQHMEVPATYAEAGRQVQHCHWPPPAGGCMNAMYGGTAGMLPGLAAPASVLGTPTLCHGHCGEGLLSMLGCREREGGAASLCTATMHGCQVFSSIWSARTGPGPFSGTRQGHVPYRPPAIHGTERRTV
jgi:hypothetical protein